MTITSIKDRIRKLLNVVEHDSGTDGEIDNALRFARLLMEKHHLSEEDLAVEPDEQYAAVDQSDCNRVFVSVGSKIYYWETLLAGFARKFVGGVKLYLDPNLTVPRDHRGLAMQGKPPGKRFCFYGISDDTALAAELFHEMRLTVISMARLKFGGCYRGDGGMYAEGFVSGLNTKLEQQDAEQRKIAEKATNATSLILLERRQDLIRRKESHAENYLSKELGGTKLRSGSRRSGANGSGQAYSEGKRDGQQSSVTVSRTKKLT